MSIECNQVFCSMGSNVRSCSRLNCPIISHVYRNLRYPSDCYISGDIVSFAPFGRSAKWYRINLRTGGFGYVNGHFCAGFIPRC